MLDRAAGLTVGGFRRAVARAVLVADPQTLEEQHAVAAAGRSVVMYPAPAGMATVAAELSAEEARTGWLALDALARANPDTTLGIDARRADGLVGLCAVALADPTLPRQHGRPAQVQVCHRPTHHARLPRPPGRALVGYGPIPTSLARALAADGTWQRLVVEPVTGHLLDAGITRYRPNQELADYVLTRSPLCEFPTCHTPARAYDIDHVEPFNREDPGSGGSTSAENNGPKCRRHHRLKTHGGWTVETHPTAPAPGSTHTAGATTRQPKITAPAVLRQHTSALHLHLHLHLRRHLLEARAAEPVEGIAAPADRHDQQHQRA